MGMPELPLDDRRRDPLVRHLDRMCVAELMLVPTSAQASICRPLGYADHASKVAAEADLAVGKVGVIRGIHGAPRMNVPRESPQPASTLRQDATR
jgi:hypothetical protein